MTPGNTKKSGGTFEEIIRHTLEYKKYPFICQKCVGTRFETGRHIVDFIIDDKLLVSVKWQEVSGTAEQKVPFEVICLTDIILKSSTFTKAYLVLGGEGWKLKNFYLSRDFLKWIPKAEGLVEVVAFEDFIRRINRSEI